MVKKEHGWWLPSCSFRELQPQEVEIKRLSRLILPKP